MKQHKVLRSNRERIVVEGRHATWIAPRRRSHTWIAPPPARRHVQGAASLVRISIQEFNLCFKIMEGAYLMQSTADRVAGPPAA